MEQTCARAVEMGLPAVAFTEHADFTAWRVRATDLDGHEHLKAYLTGGGTLVAPPLDVDGYHECVQRCRDRFPGLRIITGVELGDPHWHRAAVTALAATGRFERLLGSLHCLPVDDGFTEAGQLFRDRIAADVVRDYLAELPRLIEATDDFAVLAHIDYPLRDWPESAGPFEPRAFQDEFRYALRTLAETGRALEVNTRGPLHPEIVAWWRDEGGGAVTFGSDAHQPTDLAYRFGEAVAMVEAHGFGPGRHPYDFWIRTG
jgi:histidinol-phosphatase (PHP family)